MELTGELYPFYSDKEISKVFEELKSFAGRINYQFKIGTFYEYEDIYFYKDAEMLQYHEENGYNTDLNGEGCFYIQAKRTTLNGIATLFEFEGQSNFDPHDINLAIGQIYYYLLTIPDIIEDNEFSRKVHDALRSILIRDQVIINQWE